MKTKSFLSKFSVFSFITAIGLLLAFSLNQKLNASEIGIPVKAYGITISGMQNIIPNSTGVVKLTYSDGTVLQKPFVYGVNTYYNFSYMPIESHTVCASLQLNPQPECPIVGTCLENRTFATNPIGTTFLNVSVVCDGH